MVNSIANITTTVGKPIHWLITAYRSEGPQKRRNHRPRLFDQLVWISLEQYPWCQEWKWCTLYGQTYVDQRSNTVWGHPNITAICDCWTCHSKTMFINVLMQQLSLLWFQASHQMLEPGCRNLLPFSHNSITEVQHWCWESLAHRRHSPWDGEPREPLHSTILNHYDTTAKDLTPWKKFDSLYAKNLDFSKC